MVDHRYGIRLEMNGGGQVVAAIKEIGQAAESSFGIAGASIGTLVRGMASVPAALAGAVAAAGALAKQGIAEIRETQDSLAGLNTALSVSGNRTGLTRAEMEGFAKSLQESTRAVSGDVREAIVLLDSYGVVGGQAFLRVLRSAQDMSARFGGDIKSNVQVLGDALFKLQRGEVEGLAKGFKFLGLEALANIESLSKLGKGAEATERFLKALQDRLGGAGEAKQAGISGAMDGASKAIKQMTEDLANLIKLGPAAEATFKFIEGGAKRISKAAAPDDTSQQIDASLERMRKIQADINRAIAQGNTEDSMALITLRKRMAEEKAAYEALIDQLGQKTATETSDKKAAEDEGTRLRNAERLAEMRRSFQERMEAIKQEDDIATRVRQAREKAQNEIGELTKLREAPGADAAAVDAAIAQRRQLLERETAEIEKPLRERNERIARIIEEYRRKQSELLDPREAAATGAIDKVKAAGGNLGQQLEAADEARKAYETSGEAVKAYTAELNDYVDGQQEANRVQGQAIVLNQETQALMDEKIKRVRDEIATDTEKREELQKQVEILKQYGLSAEEADRYLRKMDPTAIKMKEAVKDLGLSFSSAFEDALVGGKKVRDMLSGLLQDIARIASRRGVTEPLAGAFSVGVDKFFGSMSGGGGGGGLMPGADDGLFSALKNIWPFAGGGVMTARGPLPLRRYAKGGVANSPQLALYGEVPGQAEAYVPLPDGRRIPAVIEMRGGNSNAGPRVEVIDQRGANAPDIEVQPLGENGVRLIVRDEVGRMAPAIIDASVAEVEDRQHRGAFRGVR